MITINLRSASQFSYFVNLSIVCLAYVLIGFDLDMEWQLAPLIISCLFFLIAILCIKLHFHVMAFKVKQQTLTLQAENVAACLLIVGNTSFALDITRSRLSYFGCWLVFTSQNDSFSACCLGKKHKAIFVPEYQLPTKEYRALCRILIWH